MLFRPTPSDGVLYLEREKTLEPWTRTANICVFVRQKVSKIQFSCPPHPVASDELRRERSKFATYRTTLMRAKFVSEAVPLKKRLECLLIAERDCRLGPRVLVNMVCLRARYGKLNRKENILEKSKASVKTSRHETDHENFARRWWQGDGFSFFQRMSFPSECISGWIHHQCPVFGAGVC